jgi:glucokinase
MKKAALGIDVGGTKTLCLLVDESCETLERNKFKTSPQEGAENFTRDLQRAVRALSLAAKEQGRKIVATGIACAGRVDSRKLKIITSQNLLALENYRIGQYLAEVLDVRMVIGNDVQMGVYGEYKMGAAKGAAHVLGVFFGTGVGGAAIINHQLYTGASGVGGQVGAVLAQPVGGPKAALSHGIVDRIASKAAIAGEALVMAVKEWAPYLHRKVGTDLSKVTWGMLSGGGLMDSLPELVLHEIEAGLREYLGPEVSDALKVKPAELGNDAVALGAAYSALEACERKKPR